MKQLKVIAGLTHQHVEKTANRWLAENDQIIIENVFQSEWLGDQGRSFTITFLYSENEKYKVKAAIPVQR